MNVIYADVVAVVVVVAGGPVVVAGEPVVVAGEPVDVAVVVAVDNVSATVVDDIVVPAVVGCDVAEHD